jgi:hypothetical protein
VSDERRVTVPAERSVYRARVEPARRLWWVGYRAVIERCWDLDARSIYGPAERDWSVRHRGRVRATYDEAVADGRAWLDRAEKRIPSKSDYIREDGDVS